MLAPRFFAKLVVTLGLLWLAETRSVRCEQPDARPAIEKGLAFLAADAASWREARQCASCHHVPMMVWALNEARAHGFAVDQAKLDENLAWMLAEDNPAKILRAPDIAALAAPPTETTTNTPATPPPVEVPAAPVDPNVSPPPPGPTLAAQYVAIAALSAPQPSDGTRAGWLRMATHIMQKQSADGSLAPSLGRSPVFLTQQENTLLGWLALSPSPELLNGNQAMATRLAEARGRMEQWLEQQPPESSTQAVTFMLLVATRRAAQPAAEGASSPDTKTQSELRTKLLAQQRADGGWSQTPEMVSDAAATGQALYALAASGPIDADVKARAVAFLLSTQQADGSWPMTSRPFGPNNDGAQNLEPIIHFGSAWAVLGLIKAL